MGSTGHWPVPSGDSPDGMGQASPANKDDQFLGAALLVPVGGSPTGTGGSPVLPIVQTRSEAFVGAFGAESRKLALEPAVNKPSANREQKRADFPRGCAAAEVNLRRTNNNEIVQSLQMATEERVLCFPRKLLEETGVFQGLSLEVEKYLPVVTSSSQLVYVNRTEAEQDKRFKQLIPYVLLICSDRILRYRRGKGGQETRLHGLYSVGIGGHISDEDAGLFSNDLGYKEGMRRELMEEVDIQPVNESAVAVINDDSTEVGYVHFGVVHIVRVADEKIVGRRSGIVGPEFIPIAEAIADLSVYESWSRLCLENLDSLLSKAAPEQVVAS